MLKRIIWSFVVATLVAVLYVAFSVAFAKTWWDTLIMTFPAFISGFTFMFSLFSAIDTKKHIAGKKAIEFMDELSTPAVLSARETWKDIADNYFSGAHSVRKELMHCASMIDGDDADKAQYLKCKLLNDINIHYSSYSKCIEKIQPLFLYIQKIAVAYDSGLLTSDDIEPIMKHEIVDLLKYGAFYLETAEGQDQDRALKQLMSNIKKLAKNKKVAVWDPENVNFAELS